MITHNIDFTRYQKLSIGTDQTSFSRYKFHVENNIEIIVSLNNWAWDQLKHWLTRHDIDLSVFLYDTWEMSDEHTGRADWFINWIIYVATSEAEYQLKNEYRYANENMIGIPFIIGSPRMEHSSLTIKDLRG